MPVAVFHSIICLCYAEPRPMVYQTVRRRPAMRSSFCLFRPRTRAAHRLVWSLGVALLALAVTLIPRAGFAMPEGGPAYLVKDINTDTQELSLYDLTPVGNMVYFVANESAGSVGLWKSDGTAAGTTRVAGNLSQYSGLTVVNGTVFFVNQSELWKIDRTVGARVLIKKIGAGQSPYMLQPLAGLQGSLYFLANYTTAPMELWKSDGTSAGTLRVKVFDLQQSFLTTSLLPNSLFFVFDYGSHKDL